MYSELLLFCSSKLESCNKVSYGHCIYRLFIFTSLVEKEIEVSFETKTKAILSLREYKIVFLTSYFLSSDKISDFSRPVYLLSSQNPKDLYVNDICTTGPQTIS